MLANIKLDITLCNDHVCDHVVLPPTCNQHFAKTTTAHSWWSQCWRQYPIATNPSVACSFLSMLLADKNAMAPGNRGQVPKPSADKTDEETLSLLSVLRSSRHHLSPLPVGIWLTRVGEQQKRLVWKKKKKKFFGLERLVNNADLRTVWWVTFTLVHAVNTLGLRWVHLLMKYGKKDKIRNSHGPNYPWASELNALAPLINYTSTRDMPLQSVLQLICFCRCSVVESFQLQIKTY